MAKASKLSVNSKQDVMFIQRLALDAMEKALKAHGVNVKYASGSFGGGTAKLRFEFSNGNAKQATTLARLGVPFLGLTPADIGKTFTSNGKTFRFTDVNPRRYKFPISAVNVKTGKAFKFPRSAAIKINPKAMEFSPLGEFLN